MREGESPRGIRWRLGMVSITSSMYLVLQVAILVANGLAILNRDRFLVPSKRGGDERVPKRGECQWSDL